MTVKTANFRGDIYKNDKNAELQCGPAPIILDGAILSRNLQVATIFS